jgi:hypothetical protein
MAGHQAAGDVHDLDQLVQGFDVQPGLLSRVREDFVLRI